MLRLTCKILRLSCWEIFQKKWGNMERNSERQYVSMIKVGPILLNVLSSSNLK